MSTPRAAHDGHGNASHPTPQPFALRLPARAAGLAVLCFGFLPPFASPALAQRAPPAAAASDRIAGPEGVELLATVQANGVARGEFALRQQADGDYWILAADLPRLAIPGMPAALRQVAGQSYYSLRALGATRWTFDEARLDLEVDFDAARLAGTAIDLSRRPAPIALTPARNSLILSYRLSARSAKHARTVTSLEHDLNVRLGSILLRQAGRLESSGHARGYRRQGSQLVWDHQPAAARVVAGDVVSSAGAFGGTITGAGLLVSKLYDMAPELVTQPTANLRATAALPSEVEVSVDGSTLYRTTVGPGPITLSNLLLYGGMQNIRVTVTDASGRREVMEQPFFFTDSVLAQGLHDYRYFIGRRSELVFGNRWRYRENAWQGWHRYGLTDALTVSAGGEGSPEFANGGAGLTLRSDRLGLLSMDLLASHDRARAGTRRGWAGRYTYVATGGSLVVGRRQFEDGFRSFLTSGSQPFLRQQDQLALSTRLGRATLGAELLRTRDAHETRTTAALRLSGNLSARTMLTAEVQASRVDDRRDWAAYLSLRIALDGGQWVGSSARTGPASRGLDLETGRQVPQGEGFGYRVGVTGNRFPGESSSYTFATASWNLRPVGLEFFGTSALGGGDAGYAEAAVNGALVGVDGYWGVTRQVNDAFVLARLGAAQAGVEISLNNQVQGKTDAKGELFIPQVGAFGRQDLSLNDRQLGMEYTLPERRRTIVPAYRSGTVVDFGARRIRAVAGLARLLRDGRREPVAGEAWTMAGPATLRIETSRQGDFYLEDAPPGSYAGTADSGGRRYACRMVVPPFAEPIHELKEGIVCE